MTAELHALAREESGRVIAILARQFGDLDLADDAVQDALLEAVEAWPLNGVPANTAGWLVTVARRKALDRLRRSASARRRTLLAAPDLIETAEPPAARGLIVEGPEDMDIADQHLRLLLLCCHPALAADSQVALTLRLVGGLSVDEIAAAHLVPVDTITQRIVRAKRKIRDAGIPLGLPADLDNRISVVLSVLYLIFNEGYLSAGTSSLVRVELADEAIRLASVTGSLLPGSAEVCGLLALMLFQRSRFATRLDGVGDLVLLPDQDRRRWDRPMITRANQILATAVALGDPGIFQLQAVIASLHANARTAQDTDWPTVAAAYAQLAVMTGSPVVRLNHAVAVAMADGPQAGLALLQRVSGLGHYHLFHAARADLLRRAGDRPAAIAAYRTARGLASNPAERRLLDRRLAELDQAPGTSAQP